MEAQNLKDINLTQEEKGLTASIINRFGTGQHPFANAQERSFDYFTVSYVKQLLKSKKFVASKGNLNPKMLPVLQSIEKKVE